MKTIIKFLALMAIVNTAGRAVSGESAAYPSVSETVECLHDIAADVIELAEKFGVTFYYSTDGKDVQ